MENVLVTRGIFNVSELAGKRGIERRTEDVRLSKKQELSPTELSHQPKIFTNPGF